MYIHIICCPRLYLARHILRQNFGTHTYIIIKIFFDPCGILSEEGFTSENLKDNKNKRQTKATCIISCFMPPGYRNFLILFMLCFYQSLFICIYLTLKDYDSTKFQVVNATNTYRSFTMQGHAVTPLIYFHYHFQLFRRPYFSASEIGSRIEAK